MAANRITATGTSIRAERCAPSASTAQPPSASTMRPETSCTVDISFTASTLGANTGSLAVTATPAGNSLTVALSANVTQPAAAGGGGGGGGCSVSGQHGAADPTLLVLALLSLALLMARRRRATI